MDLRWTSELPPTEKTISFPELFKSAFPQTVPISAFVWCVYANTWGFMVEVWLLEFACRPRQSLRIRGSFQTSATSCCWRQLLFIYFCQVIKVSVRLPRRGFEAGGSCHEIPQKTALTAGCRASPTSHELHIWTLDVGYRHPTKSEPGTPKQAHRDGGCSTL